MSDEILEAIMPQLEAIPIIENLLVQCGGAKGHTNEAAHTLIARLASHDPPILLCYPDQIKDGDDD